MSITSVNPAGDARDTVRHIPNISVGGHQWEYPTILFVLSDIAAQY